MVKDVGDRSVQYRCILVTPYGNQYTRMDVPLALNSTKAAWTSWSTVRPIVEAGVRSGIKMRPKSISATGNAVKEYLVSLTERGF